MNSIQIKRKLKKLGADLCGIASIERFSNVSVGFRPKDIYKDARSVIVFAKKCPDSVLDASSFIPYTFICKMNKREVFSITYSLVQYLEDNSIKAVPIPSEPYEYWDNAEWEGKGILSLKHAAYLAGLGVLARNTMLVNKTYGSMITLGAVLVNCKLRQDSLATYEVCGKDCNICITNCPTGALDGKKVNQKLCRAAAENPDSRIKKEKGFNIYTCNNCRKLCPAARGKA
jgi:epoxyqueuosine reductase